MSKPNSYHYFKTKGDIIAHRIKPSTQRLAIINWATDLAVQLSSQSNRKRDGFKTACVAVDEETGLLYYGRNGGINRDASNITKNPILFGDSHHRGILPKESLNEYPTPWNCAETDAINKALNAGAKLKNIHIYTIDTTKNKFGSPKASCINCTTAYYGRIKKNNTGWTSIKGDRHHGYKK